jgi:hypothetical protein
MIRDIGWLRKLAECYFAPARWADVMLDNDPGPTDLTIEDRHGSVLTQIWSLEQHEPEECWRFIEVCCQMPLTEEQLGLLGAGLFEDLMDDHGPRFIDRVKQEARIDPSMRALVDAVWTNDMDQSVIRAIKAIKRSPPLQRPSSGS